MAASVLRIGLTGGIGSGKSTVAEMLRVHGATVIDADAISRGTTAAGGAAIAPIRAAFGESFIAADGALDRGRMRDASFSDPLARKKLEAIVHPLVAQESERQQERALHDGARCIVFDIPLLAESSRWRQRLDRVLVVDCPPELQIARVHIRSGLERDAVEKIIAVQATRAQRLRVADLVLFNGGGSLQALAVELGRLAHRFGL